MCSRQVSCDQSSRVHNLCALQVLASPNSLGQCQRTLTPLDTSAHRYHETEMLAVVDAAIERARAAVDRNDAREGQLRVCLMRLIGELYNYKLLDSVMVFKVLYTVLPRASGVWGHVVPLSHIGAHDEIRAQGMPSARPMLHPKEPMGDGPDDCGRIRCVCALLETCGSYFSKGRGKRMLDAFLLYFQRYLFCKAVTVDVDFAVGDLFHRLRPNMVRAATYAEACELISKLEAHLAAEPLAADGFAHELLHGIAPSGCGGGGAAYDDEEEDDDDVGGGDGDIEDEDGDGGGGADPMAAELADVERQLAELRAEEEAEAEGSIGGVSGTDGSGAGGERGKDADDEEEALLAASSRQRREATKEEEDEFEREMNAVLQDSRNAALKKPKPPPESLPKLSALAPVIRSSAAAVGGATPSQVASSATAGGALTLRVLRRGARPNKFEADEVHVPIDDRLAQTVIRMDEKAIEERQRLKQQILAAADDHEHAPRAYIAQIRQDAVFEPSNAPAVNRSQTKGGNYNNAVRDLNNSWRAQ